MITINTSRFGVIEVEEAETIELPKGIIGFPELKKFILLDHEKDSPFKWLQSLEDAAIAFVLINPLLFKPDYTVEVTELEVGDLGIEQEEDAVISVIITVPANPKNMTANLKAPLIFNLKNRKGKQLILNDAALTTRHNILDEMKRNLEKKDQEAVKNIIETAKDQKEERQKQSEAVKVVGQEK